LFPPVVVPEPRPDSPPDPREGRWGEPGVSVWDWVDEDFAVGRGVERPPAAAASGFSSKIG
jgi:hypothetical protein